MSLSSAIKEFVHDGQKIYIGGFTHCVPYAAVHEIIRQGYRDLDICKMVPELLLEELIAANCCKKITFGWAGNPGLGNLRLFRSAYEKADPQTIEIEEYSHQGLLSRLYAGAAGLPFMICKTNFGSDIPKYNNNIKTIECPYTGELLSCVPAYNADLAIFHAHRADVNGNVQMWGLIGEHKEAAFGAKHVIVTVEEVVDELVIKSDPNKTVFPSVIVDAVVLAPYGAYPSYVQGYYDRDNDFYIEWNEDSKEKNFVKDYLSQWVYGITDYDEYAKKIETIVTKRGLK